LKSKILPERFRKQSYDVHAFCFWCKGVLSVLRFFKFIFRMFFELMKTQVETAQNPNVGGFLNNIHYSKLGEIEIAGLLNTVCSDY